MLQLRAASIQGNSTAASDQLGRPTDLSHVAAVMDSTERDVSRTDRTNKFYEGPENPGLGLLNDILLTYCMYHFDLGKHCTDGERAECLGCSRCCS